MINTKAFTKTASPLEKASTLTQMVTTTKAASNKECLMDMANSSDSPTTTFTKETGVRTSKMGMEWRFSLLKAKSIMALSNKE